MLFVTSAGALQRRRHTWCSDAQLRLVSGGQSGYRSRLALRSALCTRSRNHLKSLARILKCWSFSAAGNCGSGEMESSSGRKPWLFNSYLQDAERKQDSGQHGCPGRISPLASNGVIFFFGNVNQAKLCKCNHLIGRAGPQSIKSGGGSSPLPLTVKKKSFFCLGQMLLARLLLPASQHGQSLPLVRLGELRVFLIFNLLLGN